MMRPGHNQSTPFGLFAVGRISTVPDSGRAKLPLCLGRSVGEREVPAIGQAKNIALLVLWKFGRRGSNALPGEMDEFSCLA
jgi:hypothetical protein